MAQSHFMDRLAAGESLLGREPKRSVSTDAVRQDSFDKRVYKELLDEAPALSDLAYETLGQKYDYTEELIGDIVMEFWKSDPVLRDQKEMHPRFLLNRAVAGDIAFAPETLNTRTFTQHDRYGSAMATIAITEKIKESLDKAKEAQEAAEAAAEAMQEFMDALSELGEALGGCALFGGQSGSPSGEEGPMTEAQAVAMARLEDAIAALEDTELSMEQTLGEAQEQADKVEQALRAPIRKTIGEVGDMLAEEADMFSSWGVEDGELQMLSFEERQKLARSLRSNRLHEFRQIIGRFRMMAKSQRSRKTQFSRDEVYSVEMSDRLPDVLATEYSKLGNRHTRLEFLQALSEGQLLSKAYHGTEKVGQGSIIALVDNSGSMTAAAGNGQSNISREAFAKAFALALLDQARAANRDFVGINFSSRNQISVFRFPKGKSSIAEVLRFVEEFYGGGTDFMQPIDRAMQILEDEYNSAGLQKADLVFITDDDCMVTPEWMRGYQERKERLGFRTFGIAVGRGAGNSLGAIADNVRSVMEFVDPMAVADIIRTI